MILLADSRIRLFVVEYQKKKIDNKEISAYSKGVLSFLKFGIDPVGVLCVKLPDSRPFKDLLKNQGRVIPQNSEFLITSLLKPAN